MNNYRVTFQYSETTYCTNMVKANSEAIATSHYTDKGYEVIAISEATSSDMEEATRKGMPIITVETTEEPEEVKTLEELKEQAIQELKDNDELFVACVNELDSWNGYADGFRAYPMYELDDLHYGVSLHDFLDKLTSDFDIRDEYFYYSIYGLESTDSIEELYRDNVWESELLDNLINNYNHLDINWIDSNFDELLESIVNYEETEPEMIVTSVNIKDLEVFPETETTATETITA